MSAYDLYEKYLGWSEFGIETEEKIEYKKLKRMK